MAWLLSWLVQGLAVAIVARAAMRMLPRLSAATRYAIWWAAVLLILLLPAMRGATRIDDAAADGTGSVARATPHAPTAGAGAVDVAARSATVTASDATADTGASVVESNRLRARMAAAAAIVPPLTLPRLPDWMLAVAIGAWLGAAMLGLAQLAYSVATVRSLKQSCRRLLTPRESELPLWSTVHNRRRGVRVRASDRLRTAAVLGLYRPIIAVPRDVSASLTSAELDQVILHEYAHVRRFDDWGKLVQVAINAFVGWHPAVRLIMREIDLEREAACDDWVVSITGAPRAYARCLTKMAGFVPALGEAAAIPYAASAKHITRRIERLLAAPAADARRATARFAPLPALTTIGALVVIAFATVRALPVAIDLEHAAGIQVSESTSAAAAGVRTSRNADATSGGLRIATAAMVPLPLSLSWSLSSLTGLPTGPRAASVTPVLAPAPSSPTTTSSAAVPTETEPSRAEVPATAPAAPAPASTLPARPSHHEPFAIGPVVAAADSSSIAMVTADQDSVDKTWGAVARDATTRAVGVSARSVGSATSTAASSVKTATTTAAGHVKNSSAKTARAIGRATRKVFAF